MTAYAFPELPERHDELEHCPEQLPVQEAGAGLLMIGCTGPILKGKAPVFCGLGADTRRSVRISPHLGQGGISSPNTNSSNKFLQLGQ